MMYSEQKFKRTSGGKDAVYESELFKLRHYTHHTKVYKSSGYRLSIKGQLRNDDPRFDTIKGATAWVNSEKGEAWYNEFKK